MKRPSRTIEFFSMSALDLFASAMGAFIIITVILFPYYLKNSDIVAKLRATEGRVQQLESDNRRLAGQSARLKRRAAGQAARIAKLERQLAETRRALARVQAQVRAQPKPQPQSRSPGVRSVWSYGANEITVYEYPGREAGGKLWVGIFTKVAPGRGFRVGGIALLAKRNGATVTGDLWAYDRARSCFLRSLGLRFTGRLSANVRSLAVTRATIVVSGTRGSSGPCLFTPDADKRFTMRRVD